MGGASEQCLSKRLELSTSKRDFKEGIVEFVGYVEEDKKKIIECQNQGNLILRVQFCSEFYYGCSQI